MDCGGFAKLCRRLLHHARRSATARMVVRRQSFEAVRRGVSEASCGAGPRGGATTRSASAFRERSAADGRRPIPKHAVELVGSLARAGRPLLGAQQRDGNDKRTACRQGGQRADPAAATARAHETRHVPGRRRAIGSGGGSGAGEPDAPGKSRAEWCDDSFLAASARGR